MKDLIRDWWFGLLLAVSIVVGLSFVAMIEHQRDEACRKAGGDMRSGSNCYRVELVHAPAR